jgi:hypothetical protein
MSLEPKWPQLYQLSFAAAVCFLILGCTPRDPMDWKVQAHTLSKLDDWWTENRELLPPETASELHDAFNVIAGTTFREDNDKAMDNPNDPLCRRLDGRKIRDIIIEGHQIADESLLSKIIREQDVLASNIQMSNSGSTTSQSDYLAQTIRYQQQHINELNRLLQHNQTRLKVLAPELSNK